MTDPTKQPPQKDLDAFADEFSHERKVEDIDKDIDEDYNDSRHQVGNIAEEDDIDHFRVGDDFEDTPLDDNNLRHVFPDADNDSLSDLSAEEILDDIQINPGQDEALTFDEASEFSDNFADRELVKEIEEITLPELIALERVEELGVYSKPEPVIHAEPGHSFNKSQAEQSHIPNAETPDVGLELRKLRKKFDVLDIQLQNIKQDIAEKADYDSLQQYQDEIFTLKAALNKHPTALNFESVDAAKPIASYIAAGLGASGLLLALIIGWQNSNANSRIEELQQAVSKLQQQNSTPADNSAQANPATNPAAATDQQTIQKQLDELKAADATMAGQIADLHKVLQKNVATAKADALLSKKMASLSSQNSQVDAKLEDLQNKISSLKKTPSPAAVSAVVPPPPPPPAAAPKAEVNKAKAEDGWAVNLIAFKQDWFAKRKAEEFASKGITAKVSKADAKGQTWYRLSVDGFKSQAEAASFAEKAKKSLNLDSVLIVHSQN